MGITALTLAMVSNTVGSCNTKSPVVPITLALRSSSTTLTTYSLATVWSMPAGASNLPSGDDLIPSAPLSDLAQLSAVANEADISRTGGRSLLSHFHVLRSWNCWAGGLRLGDVTRLSNWSISPRVASYSS